MMSLDSERLGGRRPVLIVFGLLVLVGFLGCCLYASYLANEGAELSPAALAPCMALSTATVVTYYVAMLRGVHVDPALPSAVLALSAAGLTFAARLSVRGNGAYQYAFAGIASLLVMVGAIFLARWLDPAVILRHKRVLCALSVSLAFVPSLLSDPIAYGWSLLWLRVGPLPVNVGTWAKLIALVLAAGVAADGVPASARKADNARDRVLSIAELSEPLGLSMLPAAVLYGLGATHMAVSYLLCVTAMLYVHGGSRVFVVAPLALIAVMLAMRFLWYGFDPDRILVWLNPQSDPWGSGYQELQSLAAIRRGSLLGTGVGLGTPELVPIVKRDFVFAAVCEELGMVGGLVTICLYGLMALCGMRLATRELRLASNSSSGVAGFLVLGLTCLTAIDAITALGCVTGVLPATGSVLPYLSSGTNSLLDMGARLGLMLGVSTPMSCEEGEGSQAQTPESQRAHKVLAAILLCLGALAVRLVVVALL